MPRMEFRDWTTALQLDYFRWNTVELVSVTKTWKRQTFPGRIFCSQALYILNQM